MRNMSRFLSLLLPVILSQTLWAQDYQVRLTGFEQLSEYSFRFELQLRNHREDPEDTGAWAYNAGQFQLVPCPQMLNGGLLHALYLTVDNSVSDLPENQQLSDADFFFAGPHQSLATHAPPTATDDPLLLLNHGHWCTIAGFIVKLRDPVNQHFHQLPDLEPQFAFRLLNTRVFAADHYLDGDTARRGDGNGGAGTSTELAKTPDGLLVESSGRQLAGSWFYGEGPWNGASHWNQLLSAGNPAYVQHPPGPHANAVIRGQASIPSGENIVLLPGQQEQGGELSIRPVHGNQDEKDALPPMLVIHPLASLTVEKLFNDQQEEALQIRSTAVGDGSLIHQNPGVPAMVERYIPAAPSWPPGSAGWQLLSSPVAAQPLSPFTSNAAGDYRFQGWNSAANQWTDYQNNPEWEHFNNGFDFNTGQGYRVAYELEHTFAFEGLLNTTDVLFTEEDTRPQDARHQGWHLLGNPFGSALLWGHHAWQLEHICHAAQLWDTEAGSFRVVSAQDQALILPGQGFFVQAEAGGSLSIPAAARVHAHLQPEPEWPGQRILLMATDMQGATRQRTLIRFHAGATGGYDPAWDARFLPGFAPRFWSLAEGEQLALNTLPQLHEDLVIPLGFEKNAANHFRIELLEAIPGATLYLVDHREQLEHPLNPDNPYPFTAHPGDEPLRFALRFRPGGVSANAPEVSLLHIHLSERKIHIAFHNAGTGHRLEVFDLAGRLLLSHPLDDSTHHSIPHALPPGIHLVRVHWAGGVVVRKVVLPAR
jgi:hypothetical protein